MKRAALILATGAVALTGCGGSDLPRCDTLLSGHTFSRQLMPDGQHVQMLAKRNGQLGTIVVRCQPDSQQFQPIEQP